MELITKYFPKITEAQRAQFVTLMEGTRSWNEKINLISRKDIENLELRHVLHSLAIAKYTSFTAGSRIMDLGCGGGFPGLPLAILFPKVEFVLIDARAKKIMVVNDLISQTGLQNVTAQHMRAEDYKGKFDFVVSRAVASMDQLYRWSRHLFSEEERNSIPNGLISLKGGDIRKELNPLRKVTYTEYVPLEDYFDEEGFEEKYVVYAQA